jgi:hypothetical protein
MFNYPQSHFKENLYQTRDFIYNLFNDIAQKYLKVYKEILKQIRERQLVMDDIRSMVYDIDNNLASDELFMSVLEKTVIKFNVVNLVNIGAAEQTIQKFVPTLKARDIELYALIFSIYSAFGYLEYWFIRHSLDTTKLKIIENIYGNFVNIISSNPFIERVITDHLFSETKPTPENIKQLIERILGNEVILYPVYIIKNDNGLFYYIAEENIHLLANSEDRLFIPNFIPANKKIKTTYFVTLNQAYIDYNYFIQKIKQLLNSTDVYNVVIENTIISLTPVQLLIAFICAYLIIHNYTETGIITTIDIPNSITLPDPNYMDLIESLVTDNESRICLIDLSSIFWKALPRNLVDVINSNPIISYIALLGFISLLTDIDIDLINIINVSWFNSFVMYPYKLLYPLSKLYLSTEHDYITIESLYNIMETTHASADYISLDGNLIKKYANKNIGFDYRYAILINSNVQTVGEIFNPVLLARALLSL